jgi:hypothetical protein
MRPFNSALLFLLFLSISCSIVYTPITKVDLNDGAIGDAKLYIAMYEGQSLSEIPKPFRYRVLVPYLARLVPAPPASLTGGFEMDEIKVTKFKFGIVNAFGLALTAWVLFFFCCRLGFDRSLSLIGGLLFLTSFYIINYAGLPYVDAFAYFFLIVCLYAMLADHKKMLGIFFIVGIFAKETVVLAMIYPFFRYKNWRCKWQQLAACLPGLSAYLLLRYVVLPTSKGFNYNSDRFYQVLKFYSSGLSSWIFAVINLIFVFGFLWILAAQGLQIAGRRNQREILALLPILPVVLLTPFLIGSDLGRIWFLSFPVLIPLSLSGIQHLFHSDNSFFRVNEDSN